VLPPQFASLSLCPCLLSVWFPVFVCLGRWLFRLDGLVGVGAMPSVAWYMVSGLLEGGGEGLGVTQLQQLCMCCLCQPKAQSEISLSPTGKV
jgi:hypothetical protein